MRLYPQFSKLAAIGFGLILGAASARADSFSWNGVTYSSANALAQTSLGMGGGTNTLSLQFTLNNGATFLPASTVASPAVDSYNTNNTYYASGGNTASNRYLQVCMDMVNSTNGIGSVTVNIFFSKPVTNLSFSFFDVDIQATGAAGNYTDQISNIYGTGANNTKVYLGQNGLTPGTANSVTGTYSTASYGITATANNTNNLAAANATATFNSTPISELTYTYGDAYTAGGTHGTAQIIAMGDLTFTTVPEPGTLAMLGMGVFGVAGIAFRRRTQK